MKIRGLSLFANIGVAEARFEECGIDMVLANEVDERRAELYSQIYPNVEMLCGDITCDQLRSDLVNRAIEKKVNFVIATPPCQGMSVAGNRNPEDPRNQLISYAMDVINRVKPDFIFLENVPRQIRTKISIDNETIYIPEYIRKILSKDYLFSPETLAKASDFGIPQMRERNIYLLVNKKYKFTWNFPYKKETVTLREAIGNLPSLDPELREGIELTREKFPDFESKKENGIRFSKYHYPPKHPWRQVQWMLHTPSGTSAIYNDIHFPKKKDGTPIKAHHNHYRRMDWDKPSRTVTTYNNFMSTLATVHPGNIIIDEKNALYSDARVLSLHELFIVMSIPLNWNIPDDLNHSFLRSAIGEGIPSKMASDIMKVLIDKIDELEEEY